MLFNFAWRLKSGEFELELIRFLFPCILRGSSGFHRFVHIIAFAWLIDFTLLGFLSERKKIGLDCAYFLWLEAKFWCLVCSHSTIIGLEWFDELVCVHFDIFHWHALAIVDRYFAIWLVLACDWIGFLLRAWLIQRGCFCWLGLSFCNRWGTKSDFLCAGDGRFGAIHRYFFINKVYDKTSDKDIENPTIYN